MLTYEDIYTAAIVWEAYAGIPTAEQYGTCMDIDGAHAHCLLLLSLWINIIAKPSGGAMYNEWAEQLTKYDLCMFLIGISLHELNVIWGWDNKQG